MDASSAVFSVAASTATFAPLHPLTYDLLQSIAQQPRPYAEVVEAWRTSCPRLSIWEDACMAGLVECDAGMQGLVRPSGKGWAVLKARAG